MIEVAPKPVTSAFYTTDEAAVVLHRSKRTVERMIKRGIFRPDPTCARNLIPKAQVDSHLARVTSSK
jgi:excisionase family DNA binding protein